MTLKKNPAEPGDFKLRKKGKERRAMKGGERKPLY